MENTDFFYVPNELDNKSRVKRFIVAILIVGAILFAVYWFFSYNFEFPISEYLSFFAFLWIGVTILLAIKFLHNKAALKPELVLELIKDSSDIPKLKNTILNVLKIQEKISLSDLFEIKYVLDRELAELYVKNYRDLVGIEDDKQAEIMAKGESEIEIYTKSIAVVKKTLVKSGYRQEGEKE